MLLAVLEDRLKDNEWLAAGALPLTLQALTVMVALLWRSHTHPGLIVGSFQHPLISAVTHVDTRRQQAPTPDWWHN